MQTNKIEQLAQLEHLDLHRPTHPQPQIPNQYGFPLQTFGNAPISPLVPIIDEVQKISFFKAPITNTQPHSRATLRQIYNAIKGNYYQPQTDKLREILATESHVRATLAVAPPRTVPSAPPLQSLQTLQPSQTARKFKSQNFDYCTFSGIFTKRSDNALLKHSKLICLDFDHIADIPKLRFQLLGDEYLNTQLLFTSPSGNGLKWIITIDANQHTHADYFNALSNYISQTYNVEIDKSGKDLSRACFLPHDPHAYINPHHLRNYN